MNAIGPARTTQRVLWTAVGLLAMVPAGAGLVAPEVYSGVIPDALAPTVYGRDVVSTFAGVALVALAVPAEPSALRDLPALGLVAYLGYVYGVLVIEWAFDPLYLLYLTVFALAVWSLVLAIAAARGAPTATPAPTGWAAWLCAAGALLQPLLFVPLWVATLVPLMAARLRASSLHPVSVLDLGFVMPAFLLLGLLLLARRPAGALLAPPMFVLGAVLLLSDAAGALAAPLFGAPILPGGLLPSGCLGIVLAALAAVSLLALPGGEQELLTDGSLVGAPARMTLDPVPPAEHRPRSAP